MTSRDKQNLDTPAHLTLLIQSDERDFTEAKPGTTSKIADNTANSLRKQRNITTYTFVRDFFYTSICRIPVRVIPFGKLLGNILL